MSRAAVSAVSMTRRMSGLTATVAAGVAVQPAQLAVLREPGEAPVPGQQRPLGHGRRRGRVGGPCGIGHHDGALTAEAREGVPVLLALQGRMHGECPGAHDWLEVAALTLPEDAPVELLVAPELVEPVVALDPEPPVLVALVVVAGTAAWVAVLRASAGSWPVTSTTVINIHTARNSATDPPMTRARILRTRARRACLILMPSCLVMASRIGPRHSNCV